MAYIVVPPNKPPRLVSASCVIGRPLWINDTEWTVETEGDINVFLSELAGVKVEGYAETFIEDDQSFKPVWKHWQALAIVNDWCQCPRCGGVRPDVVNVGRDEGALSRTDNTTYVCSQCGVEEAMLQLLGEDISPTGPHSWFIERGK